MFKFTNCSSKRCEVKCPESHKKLTTQYKFCFMHADHGRQTSGESGVATGRLNAYTEVSLGVKNWQNLADVFYNVNSR